FFQLGEFAVNQSHQAEIDEHELHRRVTDALTERICGCVDLIGSGGDGGQGICDGKAPIVVTVPVDANFFAGWFNDFVDCELDKIVSAARFRVTDRVAEHDGASAATNRGGVESFHGGGVGARRVFSDVHHGQTLRDGELHGLFSGALKMFDGPVFHEAADGTRAKKCGSLDSHANLLGNFGNGANVVYVSARGAIRADFHAATNDFLREGFGVVAGARTGAGETNVYGVDAEVFHQMQDVNFFFDAGVAHGGILEAVAQGLVVEHDFAAEQNLAALSGVPVVDQFA